MFNDCLFFLISTVLLYGVGYNRAIVVSQSKKTVALSYVKSLLTVTSTVSLSYLLMNWLLVSSGMQELFPVVCILLFCFFSAFFDVIIRLTSKTSVSEFSVSFFCVLISISESYFLGEAVLFSVCTVSSFYILIPLLRIIRWRDESADPIPVLKNSLILFSLAALVLGLFVFDVSWLSGGIGK
ncbi:MAG: hypothetical protein J6B81_02295 [Spirochaetaceae bacterium]|nr:hypothetical protein [Spirochaetaceae bacterium]